MEQCSNPLGHMGQCRWSSTCDSDWVNVIHWWGGSRMGRGGGARRMCSQQDPASASNLEQETHPAVISTLKQGHGLCGRWELHSHSSWGICAGAREEEYLPRKRIQHPSPTALEHLKVRWMRTLSSHLCYHRNTQNNEKVWIGAQENPLPFSWPDTLNQEAGSTGRQEGWS